MTKEEANNKRKGSAFEREFAQLLAIEGFWVHLLQQNSAGQPADIIASRGGRAWLIDCKVCSTRCGFPYSRIEDNQDLAMRRWLECGNGHGWFALKIDSTGEIYMISHTAMLYTQEAMSKTAMNYETIRIVGTPFGEWVKRCK